MYVESALPLASGLGWAHLLVREWFVGRFGTPTEPQQEGWPHILAGETTLISAPTGSGKTLAAFLICIDRLVRKAISGQLTDRTEVLYVSPLKALSNDIQKNLEVPLGEIFQLAGQRGILMPEIRTAVRTGDTLAHERRAMLARPPHILVTTPESLYILLTAAKSREILRTVESVIVDEIHAVADDKRGAHLALSLERLDHLAGKRLTRIGLSATQKPIELVAHFLTGSDQLGPAIVQIGHRRELDLAVEVPGSELGAVASNEMWDEIYERLAALATQHRSTLIFVNTRRLSERMAHHLAERLGKEAVAAHHGSLSRKLRLVAEKKLRSGELRALVATASLELGIDIGAIDLVCQIGSPRSISAGLQRIGRAGHWRGAVPKGRIFATTRDELLECAALVRAIRKGDLDRIAIPEAPLDILAQQVVAMCAAEDWNESELFEVLCRAYPYRHLARLDFEQILEMLSEGIASTRGRYAAYLHRDRVNGVVRARRGSRLAAITSGGAIPENALYTVVAQPEGAVVGTVDEDFAVESLAGDIMLLGNTSWRIRRVQAGSVLVEDAQGASPTIPFWRGEAPARTDELSAHVAELREKIGSLVPGEVRDLTGKLLSEASAAISWLKLECGLYEAGAEQAVEYIVAGRAILRAVPTQTTVIAERFFDESGGMQLVIHAPFGGRINKAWGLALRKRFCRSFNFELQAAATDNGLNISLSEQHSFPLADVFHFLHANSARAVLEQAVLASPLFTARWRWDAGRALALLRFRGGKKVPPNIQRMRADDLLAAVFPEQQACPENLAAGDINIPNHPLIREVMKDVLTEAMDIDGLERVLHEIAAGRIQCLAVDTPVASPFSHEILNANPYAYLDDAPLEERRARAVEMRRVLPDAVLEEIGRLDPEAIAEVCDEAWPDVRDAEELHDALLTFIALPTANEIARRTSRLASTLIHSLPAWTPLFRELAADRRAGIAHVGDQGYWVASERLRAFTQLFSSATFEAPLPHVEAPEVSREDALLACVTGWIGHSGPLTTNQLASVLALSDSDIEKALLRLESRGVILRGKFTGAASGEIVSGSTGTGSVEWCERRLLARIHRLTLGRLRKEIQSATPAQFMDWLLSWQHVAPGTQLLGERGTLEAIRQMQGFEAAANSWESQILQRRITDFDSKVLDQLCLAGAVGWGRLSPHPATLKTIDDGTRRVIPTSVAPITFFVREEADWMIPRRDLMETQPAGLSADATAVLQFLRQRGASFFADIVRGTGKLKGEVETALWELVAAGMLTADGFDNLRALIDPKRRSGQGSGRSSRPRHSAGRWSLLHADDNHDRSRSLEATCQMLLHRYGIVFRELLTRETILPKWREVLITLRRLEDRGEIRGGRFVSGFLGEQFALPVAVESLRAKRKQGPSGEVTTISAADPLNLVGIVIPGERVPANSGRRVAFRDGVGVATDEQALVRANVLQIALAR
jgi:ATP-dependent helicase Lhr and Lhr-like helicase